MNGLELTKTRLQRKLNRYQLSEDQKNLLNKYLNESIAYVFSDNFEDSERMKPILERDIEVLPCELLTAEQENLLFQQMNYAGYRKSQIRNVILAQSRWSKTALHEFVYWHKLQQKTRGMIINANMGLVPAMVKRCLLPNIDYDDLISEGNLALLRATEKFDFNRGFKFSTYACRVIYRGFYRAIKQYYHYYNKFSVQWDPALEKDDYLEQKHEEAYRDSAEAIHTILTKNLADLSRIEESVIRLRFSFDAPYQSSPTLKKVGDRFGLSKERIRQIQKNALSKLQAAAKERMVSKTPEL